MEQHFLIETTIPAKHHDWLLGMFTDAIRAGLTEFNLILNYVKPKTQKKLEDKSTPAEREKILKTFAILLDSQGAIDFIGHALAQQKLDPVERQQLKEARAEQLAQQPPSNKQINYLSSLGYQGKAQESKLEASQIIDKIPKDKGEAA